MRIFEVNFNDLMRLLLPTFLRHSDLLLALLRAAVAPLATLHATLMAHRAATAQSMGYSSQTCYLRGMLNDTYDAGQRRIGVRGNEKVSYVELHVAADEWPVALSRASTGRLLAANSVSSIGRDSDFLVSLPKSFFGDKNLISKIRASVDRHRLATRYYDLIEM